MADVRTPELVINKLTKQQYESIQNPSDTEIYLVREDEEHKPICYPTTASDVQTTSMDLKSSVSDNGLKLTEVGFVYSNSNQSPTISDTKVICDLGCGNIKKSLSGLTMNTTYYIKSYGINQSGIRYGELLTQATWNSPIPPEYQLVEYLESSGTQYINYNFVPTSSTKWLLDYLFLSQGDAQNQNGCSASNTQRFVIASINNLLYIGMGNGTQTSINVLNQRVVVILDPINNKYIFNDYEYYFASTYTDSSASLYLFARNTAGVVSNVSIGRCYHTTIENNNILIRDMYPVYRIADNKPGMYDIVNGVFYTNQGTGEFIVGPDKEWGE